MATNLNAWLGTTSANKPYARPTSSDAPSEMDNVSEMLEDLDPAQNCSDVMSTPATDDFFLTPSRPARSRKLRDPVWQYARPPNALEPERNSRRQRLWYCNQPHCTRNSTHNMINARSHMWDNHGIRVEGSISKNQKEVNRQVDVLMAKQRMQLRVSNEDRDQAQFELRMRNIIDQDAVNRALVNLVTRNNLPHNCVEWPELRTLLACFNFAAPEVLAKSHVSMAALITKQHQKLHLQLQSTLQEARSKIHFNMDTWTSPNQIEFLAITGHWISTDGLQKKALLGLPELEAGHKGSEVARLFLERIEQLGIADKIGCITSDNATANDTAMSAISSLLNDRTITWDPVQHRTRCLGHMLNLAAQAFIAAPNKEAVDHAMAHSQPDEAFDNNDDGFARHGPLQVLRQFFQWSKDSLTRYRNFKFDQYNTDKLAPIVSNLTRWNSWYSMLQRAIKTRSTVNNLMAQKDCPYSLSEGDWTMIERVHAFLKPFYEATLQTEGDHVTLDKVLFVMDMIRCHLEETEKNYRGKDTRFHAAVTTCWHAFNKWYESTDDTPYYAAAVLLHPGRRSAYMKSFWPRKWQAAALTRARDLWLREYKCHAIQSDDEAIEPMTSLEKFRAAVAALNTSRDDEFDQFIKERMSTSVDNPLAWWVEPTQQKDYPALQRMAIDILSIPAMSAEAERIFSGARRTISWTRARLSSKAIESSECLKSWLVNDIGSRPVIPMTPK